MDILDALTKNFLGTDCDDAGDLGDLKGPEKHDYHPISTTLKRKREIYMAKVLQKHWKEYVMRKKIAHVIQDLEMHDQKTLPFCHSKICPEVIIEKVEESPVESEELPSQETSEL